MEHSPAMHYLLFRGSAALYSQSIEGTCVSDIPKEKNLGDATWSSNCATITATCEQQDLPADEDAGAPLGYPTT